MLFEDELVGISTVAKGTVPVKIIREEAELLDKCGMSYRSASVNGQGYCAFIKRGNVLALLGVRLLSPIAVGPFYTPKKMKVRRVDEYFVLVTQRDGSLGFDTKPLNPACVQDLCRNGDDKVLLTEGNLYTIEQILLRDLEECKRFSMDRGFVAVINKKGKLLHLFRYGDVIDDLTFFETMKATSLWKYV